MCGDDIVVYDPDKDAFFAGWVQQSKSFAEQPPKPYWSRSVDGARRSHMLIRMHRVVDMLGGRARIVSETQARQIEQAMKNRPWKPI